MSLENDAKPVKHGDLKAIAVVFYRGLSLIISGLVALYPEIKSHRER